jgi:ElaB/YqjD/DUF883 family membrane-anchored ribosome-binding protein
LQEKPGISREQLASSLEELASGAQGTLEQVKARAAEVSDQVRAKTGEVVEDLKQRARVIGEDAKVRGAGAYDGARQRARELREDGEEFVRANPAASLFVAVGAWFVAGIIAFRR